MGVMRSRRPGPLVAADVADDDLLSLSVPQKCDANGAPGVSVARAEALNSPQVEHRRMVVEAEHPVAGVYRMAGNYLKLSQIQDEHFRPAPLLGQHTDEVLSDAGGYSAMEIQAMRRDGAI